MKKHILVYDSSGAYIRYFKIKFPEEYNVINFFSIDDPKFINFSNVDAVIIMVNDVDEMIDVLWLCINAKTVFVGYFVTTDRTFKSQIRFRKFENIIRLDLSMGKKEMLDLILFHTRSLVPSEFNKKQDAPNQHFL